MGGEADVIWEAELRSECKSVHLLSNFFLSSEHMNFMLLFYGEWEVLLGG